MKYIYKNKIYDIDFVSRSLNDNIEIFLIDPNNLKAISVNDLPEDVQNDLWKACSDLILEDRKFEAVNE